MPTTSIASTSAEPGTQDLVTPAALAAVPQALHFSSSGPTFYFGPHGPNPYPPSWLGVLEACSWEWGQPGLVLLPEDGTLSPGSPLYWKDLPRGASQAQPPQLRFLRAGPDISKDPSAWDSSPVRDHDPRLHTTDQRQAGQSSFPLPDAGRGHRAAQGFCVPCEVGRTLALGVRTRGDRGSGHHLQLLGCWVITSCCGYTVGFGKLGTGPSPVSTT